MQYIVALTTISIFHQRKYGLDRIYTILKVVKEISLYGDIIIFHTLERSLIIMAAAVSDSGPTPSIIKHQHKDNRARAVLHMPIRLSLAILMIWY